MGPRVYMVWGDSPYIFNFSSIACPCFAVFDYYLPDVDQNPYWRKIFEQWLG
jgi:hypothetical protein